MPQIPTAPAAKACFDAVERHPALAAALTDRLLPLAQDTSQPADQRIRELRRLGDETWAAFRAQDGSAVRELGTSWPCAVEDVVAAVAVDAAGSAGREELEGVLAALQDVPPGMLSTARAMMRVRSALAAAS